MGTRVVIWGWIATIATGLFGIGCDGALVPELVRDDSPVQTDALVYTLTRQSGAWRAYALATYRNSTGARVSFLQCPSYRVRRTGPDSTLPLFRDQAWACLPAPTGSIPPGGEVTFRILLGSVDQPTMQPPLQPQWLVGRMRVEFMLCANPALSSDDCVLAPQATRQSNAFEVRFQ